MINIKEHVIFTILRLINNKYYIFELNINIILFQKHYLVPIFLDLQNINIFSTDICDYLLDVSIYNKNIMKYLDNPDYIITDIHDIIS